MSDAKQQPSGASSPASLRQAEAGQLRDTVRGFVKMLVEILEMTHPKAMNRGARVRKRAMDLARELEVKPLWAMEMAVMLSPIGCICLPQQVQDKLESGEDLTKPELKVFRGHPGIAAHLLGNIALMSPVADIIRHQTASSRQGPPLGSMILRACLDLDHMERKGAPLEKALELMARETGTYDPAVVEALARLVAHAPEEECLGLAVADLQPGMVMARDMLTETGDKLLLAGQALSEASHMRLLAFADELRVREPVCVQPGAPRA